jgi:hypothetical protein
MYLDGAIAEDKKMVECWKGDAEGMLVFVRLQTTPPPILLRITYKL